MAKIKNNGLRKKKCINLDYHPADSRIRIVDSEVCQTLNSRMGTGGNNVPLIMIVDDQGGKNISADKKCFADIESADAWSSTFGID